MVNTIIGALIFLAGIVGFWYMADKAKKDK